MAENKQNQGSENKQSNGGDKTTGSAASTKQAKDTNSATTTTGGGGGTANAGKDALSQVKESVGAVAGDAVAQVKEKASSAIDEQKGTLASGVASVADSVRQIGENLSNSNENKQVAALAGKYGDNLAAQIERFSSYIDEKEIKELVQDVEQFARRNPLLFVGGAFALGVFAARFLKSSGRRQTARNRS